MDWGTATEDKLVKLLEEQIQNMVGNVLHLLGGHPDRCRANRIAMDASDLVAQFVSWDEGIEGLSSSDEDEFGGGSEQYGFRAAQAAWEHMGEPEGEESIMGSGI